MISGFSRDGLVELIELSDHPWFVGTPVPPGVHVESARRPSVVPSFIEAALAYQGLAAESRDRVRTRQ